MPEAAMHENNLATGNENDVWASWQCLDMQSIAITESMENPPDCQFRACVRRANSGHDERTFRWENVIHHTLRFPEQRPLIFNIFLGSVANDPSDRDLLLLGNLSESFVNVRWKTDRCAESWAFCRFHFLIPCRGLSSKERHAPRYTDLVQMASYGSLLSS